MADSVLGVHAEAEAEIEAAFEYLEERRPGHGYQFLERYREAVRDAIESPNMGFTVPGYAVDYDVRKYVLTQFSYALVVATLNDRRTVVALEHHRNREDYFRQRLE